MTNYIVHYYHSLLDLARTQAYEQKDLMLKDAQDFLSAYDPAIVVITDLLKCERKIWIHNGEATYRVRDMDNLEDRLKLTVSALCIDTEHSKSVNKQP